MDQFHHLTCQEPSLTCLVSGGNDRRCHFCQTSDISRRCKMAALCKSFACRLSHPFDCFDSPVCHGCLGLLESKIFYLKVLIIEAVAHEIDQIRYNCLSAFRFQKLCQMIICSRQELDKDLTYDAHTRLLHITDRNGIKFVNHFAAHFLKLAVADTASA